MYSNTATLSGLMSLYERNYILLERLLEQDTLPSNLQVECTQMSPWTRTIRVKYNMRRPRGINSGIVLIQIKVRLYDDTRQAAVYEPDEYLLEQIKTEYRRKELFVSWYINKFLCNILHFFFTRKNHLLRREL